MNAGSPFFGVRCPYCRLFILLFKVIYFVFSKVIHMFSHYANAYSMKTRAEKKTPQEENSSCGAKVTGVERRRDSRDKRLHGRFINIDHLLQRCLTGVGQHAGIFLSIIGHGCEIFFLNTPVRLIRSEYQHRQTNDGSRQWPPRRLRHRTDLRCFHPEPRQYRQTASRWKWR